MTEPFCRQGPKWATEQKNSVKKGSGRAASRGAAGFKRPAVAGFGAAGLFYCRVLPWQVFFSPKEPAPTRSSQTKRAILISPKRNRASLRSPVNSVYLVHIGSGLAKEGINVRLIREPARRSDRLVDAVRRARTCSENRKRTEAGLLCLSKKPLCDQVGRSTARDELLRTLGKPYPAL